MISSISSFFLSFFVALQIPVASQLALLEQFSFDPKPSPATEEKLPNVTHPTVQAPEELSARSVVLFDIDSDTVFFAIGKDERLPIASLTKVMTGLVALRYLDPEDTVTVSADAAATYGSAGDIRAGETFSVRDLIAAMMMYSSNDAATALAEAAGARMNGASFEERMEKFVGEMRAEAAALGMSHTVFENPTGLDLGKEAPSNYSTSEDYMRLVRATIDRAPLLWALSRESQKTIYSSDSKPHQLMNTNLLVERIPHFIGSKTGSTDVARESVVILYEYPLGHREGLILLGADPGRRFEEAEYFLKQVMPVL